MGWSAQELADRVMAEAARAGENLSLTQQAISFFETGKGKSKPRWLRFVDSLLYHCDLEEGRPVSPSGQYLRSTRRPFSQGDRDVAALSNPPSFNNDDDDDDVEIDAIDIAYGMGGTFLDFDQAEIEKARFSRSWLRKFTEAPPQLLFSADGIGDSMWPTIHDRDTIIGDRSQRVIEQADKIWAVVYGGVGMIKRLRPLPDGTVRIMSDNPQVSDELATDGDLFIVGRVAAIVRRV